MLFNLRIQVIQPWNFQLGKCRYKNDILECGHLDDIRKLKKEQEHNQNEYCWSLSVGETTGMKLCAFVISYESDQEILKNEDVVYVYEVSGT